METAFLDVRVLPWRPRARVLKPDTLRDNTDPFFDLDIEGFVIGIALWLLIIVAAPLIVLVLAVLLFSVELPIVIVLAGILVVVRFTGLVPWTVVIVDAVGGGEEKTERYRLLWRAIGRIRAVNSDRRVKVRWAWA